MDKACNISATLPPWTDPGQKAAPPVDHLGSSAAFYDLSSSALARVRSHPAYWSMARPKIHPVAVLSALAFHPHMVIFEPASLLLDTSASCATPLFMVLDLKETRVSISRLYFSKQAILVQKDQANRNSISHCCSKGYNQVIGFSRGVDIFLYKLGLVYDTSLNLLFKAPSDSGVANWPSLWAYYTSEKQRKKAKEEKRVQFPAIDNTAS
ncbi:hypothetical protein V8C35DRAFT_139341 [Trichoderma chlorosporum]